MAAGFHSFDHQRIDARADQFLSERQRRRKADDLGARRLDRFQAALRRQAAGKHDMADAMSGAHGDQLEKLRMHGNQVDAEIACRQRLRRRDLGIERSEEHTSELQSLMRIAYAVFCLKKNKYKYI